MVIDCDTCQVAGLSCHDCVVSVLLGVPEMPKAASAAGGLAGAEHPSAAVVHLDEDHARAIEALAEGGMVPPLRLRRSAS